MSSRELLELIEFLPDRSAYKTARRAGDWSAEEYRQADLINSVACQLESYQPVLSPMQQHVENAVDQYRLNRHAENLAQLRGERRVSLSGN